MQILASSLRAFLAVIGLTSVGTVSADAVDPSAAAAAIPPVHAPDVIGNCDGSVSECASQFEKIVTVYQHNATTVLVSMVTTNVTLPPTTITSTAVTITTKINKTETDALCEKTFVVTLPGTSTVTVHLNSTHINKIIPTSTTVTTSTITQYETEVSVCLMQGTHQFPLRPPRGSQAPVFANLEESTAPRPTAAAGVNSEVEDSFISDAGVEEIILPEQSEDEDEDNHSEL